MLTFPHSPPLAEFLPETFPNHSSALPSPQNPWSAGGLHEACHCDSLASAELLLPSDMVRAGMRSVRFFSALPAPYKINTSESLPHTHLAHTLSACWNELGGSESEK